jgi:hypothetical protein
MQPVRRGRAGRRAALFSLAILGAVTALGIFSAGWTADPAAAGNPTPGPTGHIHIHKYVPKSGGSGWKHEGNHDWNFAIDGATDYTARNNDSKEVAQGDYTVTEVLTSAQQADGWQLLDFYLPDHGQGSQGGGNDKCEEEGPRAVGERQTAAQVLSAYFTDQDHNNNGTIHLCAYNTQQPTTRTVRVQKVTSATAHPGGSFTVSVGAQAVSTLLNPNAAASSVQTISGAPVNQSLSVSETVPTTPPGWSLNGFTVKSDPSGTATCSASESGWQTTASVPSNTTSYLVCAKNSYVAILGAIHINKDDRADADAPAGNAVGGATYKLERIQGGSPVETFCVTDDSSADSDTATAVTCGTGSNRDDEDAAAGVTTLSGLTLGSWRVTEVGVPAGYGADVCTGARQGVRDVTLSSSVTDQTISGAGCSPTSAFHDPLKPVTVHAYKAVCGSFADVPRNVDGGIFDHYGELASGPVNATVPVTAGAPLPAGCQLATQPFGFRYSFDTAPIVHPNPMPFTGAGFGPNGPGGYAEVTLDRSHFTGGHLVWISEVPAAGYAFAGLRCYRDVVNQDNLEYIDLASGGDSVQDVYCIAYNVATGGASGEKYHDLNGSGVRDAGEPGLEGWTVTASRINGPAIDPFVTTTDSSGHFSFLGLPEGQYTFCEAAQSPWTPSQPATGCYTRLVPAGGAVSDLSFGNMRPASLTVVKVDLGLNGKWKFDLSGPVQAPRQTVEGSGSVTFSGLRPGTYAVAEANGSPTACTAGQSVPGDFETRYGTSGSAGSAALGTAFPGIQVGSGQSLTVYFFNRECGNVLTTPSLYIQKFSDPDGNRTGTEGLAGFQFIVKKDGVPLAGSPFTSPAGGLIVLSGLGVGTYTVAEVPVAPHLYTGWRLDMGDDGTFEASGAIQPVTVELRLGDAARVDMYNQLRGTIRVHKSVPDDNGNAPGEGWEFALSGCGVNTSAMTDSAGEIEWVVPYRPNCTYHVDEKPRTGWIAVTPASQDAKPGQGETVLLGFLNSRLPAESTPTAVATCTPTPTSTATLAPGEPTNTPGVPPTSTFTPVSTVGGERTPRPPETGCGAFAADAGASRGTLFIALGLAALVFAGGGFAFYATAGHTGSLAARARAEDREPRMR